MDEGRREDKRARGGGQENELREIPGRLSLIINK